MLCISDKPKTVRSVDDINLRSQQVRLTYCKYCIILRLTRHCVSSVYHQAVMSDHLGWILSREEWLISNMLTTDYNSTTRSRYASILHLVFHSLRVILGKSPLSDNNLNSGSLSEKISFLCQVKQMSRLPTTNYSCTVLTIFNDKLK